MAPFVALSSSLHENWRRRLKLHSGTTGDSLEIRATVVHGGSRIRPATGRFETGCRYRRRDARPSPSIISSRGRLTAATSKFLVLRRRGGSHARHGLPAPTCAASLKQNFDRPGQTAALLPPRYRRRLNGLAATVLQEPETIEIGARRSPAETVTHAVYPGGRRAETRSPQQPCRSGRTTTAR